MLKQKQKWKQNFTPKELLVQICMQLQYTQIIAIGSSIVHIYLVRTCEKYQNPYVDRGQAKPKRNTCIDKHFMVNCINWYRQPTSLPYTFSSAAATRNVVFRKIFSIHYHVSHVQRIIRIFVFVDISTIAGIFNSNFSRHSKTSLTNIPASCHSILQ